MIEKIIEWVILGILTGCLYGLLALGLSLQYSVCRVLNITHGEFVMLGAMLSFTISKILGTNILVALGIVGPLLFIIGFVLQITLFRTMRARAPSLPAFEGNALLAAFGIMYVITYIALIRWGANQVPSVSFTQGVPFLWTGFPLNLVITFAASVGAGAAMHLFLTRSRLGKAIRATAEDPATAELMGVNTSAVMALCFGLGALLAAVAGGLIATREFARTTIGFSNTLLALVVLILGGVGSIPGSYLAGILIGIVSVFVARLWVPVLTIPVYYAMLMILLLVRPTGILGKK